MGRTRAGYVAQSAIRVHVLSAAIAALKQAARWPATHAVMVRKWSNRRRHLDRARNRIAGALELAW